MPAVARFTATQSDPVFVTAATTAFAGVAAFAVLALRGELARLVRSEDVRLLVLLGALGTVAPFLLFYVGASRISAIEVVLCLQVEPFYSLLLAWWALGHRLTLRRVAAALLLLVGIGVSVAGGIERRGSAVGVLLLLATPLCWQLSHLLVLRRLSRVPAQVLTGARYVYGGLLLAPALLWTAPQGLSSDAPLGVLALQGVVLSYAGTMLWYLAIARLDLARATAIVVPSIPVLSVGVSYAVLGELPTPRQGLGMLVTIAGVAAFALAPHAVEERERIPAPSAPIALPVEPDDGSNAA